ncbi:MAG: hydrolase [Oscillospiraceae bacterium]|jgi:predicted hydrolase (HD superfamily)|nr:hydrolase [Oscillospiraceae bacterium]
MHEIIPDTSREASWELLNQYNQDAFHLIHARVMEGVLRAFANDMGYAHEANFWANVGLLHDLDFEQYPSRHCEACQPILKDAGYSDRFIRAVACHGFGLTGMDLPEPEHPMEKVLFAADELTGLIGAVARMRPSKSVSDLEVSSVIKKFKTPKFAAGCSREVIQRGADNLGWSLETLIERTITAMRSCDACE